MGRHEVSMKTFSVLNHLYTIPSVRHKVMEKRAYFRRTGIGINVIQF